MTTKRRLLFAGMGSVGCLVGSAVSLVVVQLSMAFSWGTQVQLLPFRPWTGRMASPWEVMMPWFGYAVSLFLFAAIILAAIFVKSLVGSRKLQTQKAWNSGGQL